jgi:hypothetical protein
MKPYASASQVRGLADLMGLPKAERAAALESAGLTAGAIGDLETTLGTVPVLTMNASCETEGEEGGIMEGDLVTANVHVCMNRFSAKEAGGGVGSPPSFAPFYAGPRGESWCVCPLAYPLVRDRTWWAHTREV